MNRNFHHIGFFVNAQLNEDYEKSFCYFDLMAAYLYDVDFQISKESENINNYKSINRLKKC